MNRLGGAAEGSAVEEENVGFCYGCGEHYFYGLH